MAQKMNILIGQSGGPTAVINASLAGALSYALKSEGTGTVYGAVNGIEGFLNGQTENLTKRFQNNSELLDRLKYTPAMYLGSCRYKLPVYKEAPELYGKIFSQFLEYGIGCFLYIGGNDSMDTVSKLSAYGLERHPGIRIIGIPKTIDNDLTEIDHTPGYGSAAKYIAASMLEMIHDTCIYPMQSVLLVEIMGRNAGWLTAAAALARNEYNTAPHLVYLPEVPFSTSAFIQEIKQKLSVHKHVIAAISEGIRDTQNQYISAQASRIDQFGHIMLSGTGKYLEGLITDTVGCKVRSVELSVLQRCAGHTASLTDITEAFTLGEEGVAAALLGHSGKMVTMTRAAGTGYEVNYGLAPIERIANAERKVPREWIHPSGHDIMPELLDYVRPLIAGEAAIPYRNGIPDYLFRENADAQK